MSVNCACGDRKLELVVAWKVLLRWPELTVCFGKEDILLDGKLEGGSEMIVLLVSFEEPICAVDCE